MDRDCGHTGTVSPPLPTIPRFPMIGDPLLRRIRVPDDLDAATTVGRRGRPGGGRASTREQVERIWEAALGLYRSGVHPALQLCVRREGEVVLDRAIGHARGNGPSDGERRAEGARRRPRRRSASTRPRRRITAMVVHMLVERGALRARRPGRRAHPRVRAPRQGRDHDRPRARPPRRRRRRCRARRSTSTCSTTASTCSRSSATRSRRSAPGKLLAYHAVSGGFILGEVVQRVTGKDDPRPCSPRRSSTRSASAG